MLKLLKYGLDADGIVVIFILGILWLVIIRLFGSFVLPILAVEVSEFLRFMVAPMVYFLTVTFLFYCIVSTMYNLLVKERSYLLFTLPQPASKILLAALLSTIPLWALMVVFIISTFPLGLESLSRLYPGTDVHAVILNWTIIFYTSIIAIFFSGVATRTILHARYHRWYRKKREWVKRIGFIGLVVFLQQPLLLFLSRPLSPLEIPLLIAVSTALFFTSAYLLENKLDIWE